MFGVTFFAIFWCNLEPWALESVTFCIFLPPWGPKGTRASKSVKKCVILEFIWKVIFALFRYFFEHDFVCIFQVCLFSHFGPMWYPMVSKMEVLGDHFDAISGAGPICENVCFP